MSKKSEAKKWKLYQTATTAKTKIVNKLVAQGKPVSSDPRYIRANARQEKARMAWVSASEEEAGES